MFSKDKVKRLRQVNYILEDEDVKAFYMKIIKNSEISYYTNCIKERLGI